MYDELVKRLRAKARLAREYNETGKLEDEAADAIEELVGKTDRFRWIPVTERLPEVDGDYLVWFYDAKCWKVAEFNKHTAKERYVWWFAGIDRTKYVTHWMPLPEPPKEE